MKTGTTGDPGVRRRWVFPALLAYMGLVFTLSHFSRPPLPEVLFHVSDKILHAIEYAPLGLLWALAFGRRGVGTALLGWAAAVAFGMTDEIHQAFVPGRNASVFDLLADAAGAGVGAAISLLPAGMRGRGSDRP